MTLLTIVLPCYNESENIPLILERFNKILESDTSYENLINDLKIILVDNGSNDNTDNLLKQILPKYKFAKSIRLETNKGYGNGIISGLKEAQSPFVGWTHADFQTDIKDVIFSLKFIKTNQSCKNILIKGKRVRRNNFDNFFSIGMSIFESILFLAPIYEVNAQPNIFHHSLLNRIKKWPNDFSIDLYLYLYAIRNNFKIIRYNVEFSKRIHGESKWNTSIRSKFKFILRTLIFSIRTRLYTLVENKVNW